MGLDQCRLVLQVVCPDHSILRSFWLITHQDTQNLSKVRAGKDWLTACVKNDRSRLLKANVKVQ